MRVMARRVRWFGLTHWCPICRSAVRQFLPHGVVPRPNAVCPVCQSRDRHRLAWLWLTSQTRLGREPVRLLHIAPEPELARRLTALPAVHYVSGDIVHRASVRMDVCSMPFGTGSFDLIYCSHVLNMLPEDQPALAELFRVLRPGGQALLQVPVTQPGAGVEVSSTSTAEERRAKLGDAHMYRRYERDALHTRLRKQGFHSVALDWYSSFTSRKQLQLGLIDEPLHVCQKLDST